MKNSKKTAKDLTIIFSALALLAILCSGVKTYYTSTTDVPKDTYVNPESTPHIEEYVEVESLTAEPVTYQTPEYTEEISNTEFEYLIADDFKLTHYCHCAKCCGRTGQPTASGRMPELGVTVGVDPNLIKLGSYLRIELPDGNGGYKVYRKKARADDTGGAIKGNKIDVFVGGHQEALNLGVIHNARVYLIGEQQ